MFIKKGIFLLVVFIFLGCSSRQYVPSSSGSYKYKPKSTTTKIKNSANMHRATMRPYTVMGKTYYPTKVSVNDSFSGIASWYGPNFHNKKTSNGEYYNMYDMTAAHKTLPMNTMLRVTNLDNSKQIIVRINDRGPFVKSRIIDLSNEAAHRIDMVKKGTAPVRIEVVGFDGVVGGQNATKSVVLENYYVQIGAFRNKNGAYRYASRYKKVNNLYTSDVTKGLKNGIALYRVYLKGFKSESEARDFIAKGDFSGAYILRK
ncbi:septal ring lytic transglycosylase RlpA family protein [Sulfurospirillum arcachonense]|uniref:septal ring lytic transglycosylase RlpA family protein n=1 Tax=Sulfurospirillum arcachonense TaxID=57666 RepID=UPI0004BAF987|nr:septal ring lytic transglycosylase RlpA family protein [Sulfurospirillum arcachonense]